MKKNQLIALIVLVVLIIFWVTYLYPTLKGATAYGAKYTCSYTYLSNIEQKNIDEALNFFPANLVQYSRDTLNRSVTGSFFGFLAKQTANYYEDGVSCGCVMGDEIPHFGSGADSKVGAGNLDSGTDTLYWPQGSRKPDTLPAYIDSKKLNALLDSIITIDTGIYAIVIAQKDLLVAEKYQDGVYEDSRLLGWSMTKTIGNALYGNLVKNGKMDVNEPTGISSWEDDDRSQITVSNLLQMSSGLKWTEDYSKLSNVTRMLYLEQDFPAYAKTSPLIEAPDSEWLYSSGTSNILSGIMRSTIHQDDNYWAFPYDSLFNVVGMHSGVIETDNASNFVLSSYCWATALDWTKFGLLYLYNGYWYGHQVFTPDWVEYSTTPGSATDNGYGAQVWLNASSRMPDVPKDAYYENGFGGQRILISPSQNLVITILAGQQNGFDFNAFYKEIFGCFDGWE